jgi:DNA polymerase-3 subunit delta'
VFNIQGHEAAVRTFQNALSGDRLHHAYLLTGPAHVGKLTLAMQVAQAVNCLGPEGPPCGVCNACTRIAAGLHADVRIIAVDPEAAEGPRTAIGIEAVRDLIASAHLRPYEGRTRVFIINEADRMTHDAANALLKVPRRAPAQQPHAIARVRRRWSPAHPDLTLSAVGDAPAARRRRRRVPGR